MLQPGNVFKTATGDLWYVEYVTNGGAYCIALTSYQAAITTRKGLTKQVFRHLSNTVFSPNSEVDLVDPRSLDSVRLQRRLAMARKEGTVMSEGTATATPETTAAAPAAPRASSKYIRTDKVPTKEMRGQSKETFDALNSANGQPLNVAEVAAKCVFAGSRQDKERVAGFYIARFKKEGLIVVAPEAPAPAAPAA